MDTVNLFFEETLPPSSFFKKEKTLLIYDKVLEKQNLTWIQSFPLRYPVKAGETLKDLRKFPAHLEKIANLLEPSAPTQTEIVAMGGGSVGDFAGTVAALYKRGVSLIHIPSTWLAAIDSSHGGKTALNLGGVKNQVGTFYSAHSIYISSELLFSQPQSRFQEALGELFKIALLEGNKLWEKFKNSPPKNAQDLWGFLGQAIEAKYKIVAQDPFEELGLRRLLNLGHTLGHALESTHGLPHGNAVNLGISFALWWSHKKGHLKYSDLQKVLSSACGATLLKIDPYLKKKYFPQYQGALSRDKKFLSSQKLTFIFIKNPGFPIMESITVEELLEALFLYHKEIATSLKPFKSKRSPSKKPLEPEKKLRKKP